MFRLVSATVHAAICESTCHPGTFSIMVSTQVRRSTGFKSRSGQIAYFHGVKTRLSTLGTGDVPRGSDST